MARNAAPDILGSMKLVALLAFAMFLTAGAAACSSKASEERKEAVTRPADEPRPAEPARSTEPATTPTTAGVTPTSGTIPNDFPKDCVGYAALIDKLRGCDKLGGARASLLDAYESLRSAWSTVPADRREEFARQCATQAESVRNAAAATCGL
jgi:hypothetical protein